MVAKLARCWRLSPQEQEIQEYLRRKWADGLWPPAWGARTDFEKWLWYSRHGR